MTPDDVRATAEQLVDFHERFAPLFSSATSRHKTALTTTSRG
jgi:hypothetical protein